MNEDRAARYQLAYLSDYGFERDMVHYRRELLLDRLDDLQPSIVVEIGCGSELLYEAWLRRGGKAECWVTIEPAEQFAHNAITSGLPGLHVIRDFFECAVPEVKAILPRSPDWVICSSLLHEVPSATDLLTAIHAVMGEATLLHANVPNAGSFHRRLAKAMGLIPDIRGMSDRNRSLLQYRVYDMAALKQDCAATGFSVVSEGGYLVKPFTHGQMEKIVSLIGDDVLDGLYRMGKEMPELASEIYIEARRAGR